MPKRLKHISELPEWFQLEKYEFTKSLFALGWYEQFFVRGTFLYHARDMRKNNEIFPDDFKQAMQASRENPNAVIENDPRLANYCTYDSTPGIPEHPLKTLKQKSSRGLKAIKSITMRDYIGFKFLLQPERTRYIEDWFNQPNSKKETHPEDAPWFNEPICNSYTPMYGKSADTVSINLRLPDSLLIESFKKYLAEKRKTVPAFSTKHYRETAYDHWADLGILPYLDLIIWGIETETQIPNRVLADALYPSGDKCEETIRKTTSQLAETLLDSKSIFQLIMQAAEDISEKNNI
jgi:hypothetical protein